MEFSEQARAKVNLWLEIVGRRADGYHLLDSLVVFADVADVLTFSPVVAAEGWALEIRGPFANGLSTAQNLVLDTARYLAEHARQAGIAAPPYGRFVLQKNLPVAAGLGGGSSDAAAVFKLFAAQAQYSLTTYLAALSLESAHIARDLGADIPVCLVQGVAHMTGIGDIVAPRPARFACAAVLVNPRVALSTRQVFAQLSAPHNEEGRRRSTLAAGEAEDLSQLVAHLKMRRNDLQVPARQLAPVVGEVLDDLSRQPGCLLARLSGSGPTCFALFSSEQVAREAAAVLQAEKPGWWVRACTLTL